MAIALIIIILIIILFPYIMRWGQRFMLRRAEDYLRKATGMPPRDKKNKTKRQNTYHRKTDSERSRERTAAEPIIPREYAVDVEFTETKEFSEDIEISADGEKKTTTFIKETQVTDVEWEEIGK